MFTRNLSDYRKAAAILLALFLAAFFLTSCEMTRDCRGAGRENGYVGYDAGSGHHAIGGPKRVSY